MIALQTVILRVKSDFLSLVESWQIDRSETSCSLVAFRYADILPSSDDTAGAALYAETNAMFMVVQREGTMDAYVIRINSRLGTDVAGAFAGFVARPANAGDTLLVGHVADQTALYGVLMQARDFGLELIEVRRLVDDSLHAWRGKGP